MKKISEWFSKLQIEWISPVVLFALALGLAIFFAFLKYKKKRVITPNRILFAGTFISAVAFFMPLYSSKLTSFQAILNSIQHAFRLFALEGDFMEKVVKHAGYPEGIKQFYISFGSVLYAFAPMLTFGFILSFFKNVSSHLKYNICFWAKAHVFSELNEKTLALATDLNKNNKPFLGLIPRILIVFTDVVDKKEELTLELIEDAKELGAILFRKDLESIRFKRSWSKRHVNFYLISEEESEKIRHAESVMANYDYKNVELRVFSDDIRTELMLAARVPENMEVERVNGIQSLIYRNLYVNGINLFERAREIENEGNVISVVIVGLGKYGREMLKALTWYCQMDKYKLKINAFDTDEKAKEKFVAMCPELLNDKYNKKHIVGEPYYEIDIHSGVDVSVPSFEEELKKIKDATYFFVCLGNDETNLEVSAKIRAICERIEYEGDGHKPDIETVIYDSTIKAMGITWEDVQKMENDAEYICGVTNYKSQPYNILMTGDMKHFYSEETVIDSALVDAGRSVHISYSVEGKKISFTENFMHDEWDKFIKENKLITSWKVSLATQEENEKKELSENIDEFSFLTAKEQEEMKTADKEKIKALKNVATERVDKWEKIVYSRFNELMNDPKFSKEWEKQECKVVNKAKKDFRFEYNYRSSIAKAIHKNLRSNEKFKTELHSKPWEKMTVAEKVETGMAEHIRWNAYMRTEGYSYADIRNDLAKVHHNLVPVSELTNDDLRKDA